MISHGSLSNKNLNHRTNAFTRKIGPNHASRKKIGDLQVTFFSVSVQISRNTYMLFTGWEVRIGRNCARGLEYRAVLRPRAQFLPIRTNLSRWVTFSFFCYWDLKVSGKFYCSLQPMCVKEGRVRVGAIQSARSIANQNKTLQHDFWLVIANYASLSAIELNVSEEITQLHNFTAFCLTNRSKA